MKTIKTIESQVFTDALGEVKIKNIKINRDKKELFIQMDKGVLHLFFDRRDTPLFCGVDSDISNVIGKMARFEFRYFPQEGGETYTYTYFLIKSSESSVIFVFEGTSVEFRVYHNYLVNFYIDQINKFNKTMLNEPAYMNWLAVCDKDVLEAAAMFSKGGSVVDMKQEYARLRNKEHPEFREI